MEILIISGLSGGGKSKAASFLEDIGYYTVDNLPAEMMMKFAGFCAASSGRYDRVALVYDVRSGEPTDMLIDTLEQLKASGVNCRMLFLEADTPTIINRYKETRRMHPLQAKGLSVEEAVRRERHRAGGNAGAADAPAGAGSRGFRAGHLLPVHGQAPQ